MLLAHVQAGTTETGVNFDDTAFFLKQTNYYAVIDKRAILDPC